MKLTPLADRVILKMVETKALEEMKAQSGVRVLISEEPCVLYARRQLKKAQPQVAEVVAVGPGGMVDGKEVTMTVKPGDKVITSQYAGTKVTLEDVEYVVVRQNDILAIVE